MRKIFYIFLILFFFQIKLNADEIILHCKKGNIEKFAVIDFNQKKLSFEQNISKDLDWFITSVNDYEIKAESPFVRTYNDGFIYSSSTILIINRMTGKVSSDRRVEQVNKNPGAKYDLSGIPVIVIPELTCEPLKLEQKF